MILNSKNMASIEELLTEKITATGSAIPVPSGIEREIRRLFTARNLLRLAQHHKKFCHEENCEVILFDLLHLFESHKGDAATPEERQIFC